MRRSRKNTSRLGRQIDLTADRGLIDLLGELRGYPSNTGHEAGEGHESSIVVPLQLSVGGAVLHLFSTTTVFGTPIDVTLSEIALEAFYPADAATAQRLRAAAATEAVI